MNENQEEKEDLNESDLQAYLKDMENLETDFSDLDDLEFEEIQEMQEAIAKVREENITSEDAEIPESENEINDYIQQKDDLISDFSDIEQIDFDELKEMKQAIESVKKEELHSLSEDEIEPKPTQEISGELEERIKLELLEKKKKEEKEIITPEKFLDYVKQKREKIWYHSLYYLVFEVEDHTASKALLYDILKEVTSKSAIDPIPEPQFYFGLGYILRLSLKNEKIIRYMSGKFKINPKVNFEELKEILEKAGKPISTRPVIEEGKKKEMFRDFLKDDFLDI
ncbi:MAG: hypothetical protein EU540_07470 [Promethearchaeota archaeon]|nr:MAG: hypothetical protein EU540_07470 [Candidatus Lokiarchaeota archaeon]